MDNIIIIKFQGKGNMGWLKKRWFGQAPTCKNGKIEERTRGKLRSLHRIMNYHIYIFG
jgi:hypothetical protein